MRKRIFLLALIISLMYSLTAFANVDDFPWEDYTDINYNSKLLPKGVTYSSGTNQNGGRGEVIAISTVSITNLGNGYVQITGSTSSHIYCDRIRMRIYLDKYNESKETWENIKSFTYDVKSEDVGGELYLLTEGEDIKVQKGCYYRARGIHTVYKDGETEGFSTYTDGILAD